MSAARRDGLIVLALLVVLMAMYAPVLRAHYYMRDEFMLVQDTKPGLADVAFVAGVLGWKNARPLAYPFYGVYSAVDARGGLWCIRISQLVMAGAAAVFFFRLLRRRAMAALTAAGVVLFLWSQPTISIYSAYCGMAPYWMGVCGGWWAYLLLRRDETAPLSARRLLVATLLLFGGWLTFQAAPFGALVPAVYYGLTATPAQWPTERRTQRITLALLGFTVLLYIGFTKLTLAVSNVNLTSPVRRAFALLSGAGWDEYRRLLDPVTLLEPFEWWNYALPVASLSNERFLLLTGLSALLWVVVVACAWRVEASSRERSDTHARFGMALLAVALTYAPVALEGLTGLRRQHVFVAFVPAALLFFVYAAGALWQARPRPAVLRIIAGGVVGGIVAGVCAGTHAGLDRGVVQPHAAAQRFIEQEIRQRGGPASTSLTVVTVQEAPCLLEPCKGLFGRTAWSVSRASYPKLFRRVAQEAIGRSGLPVTYISESDPMPAQTAQAIVIDFRRFVQR